jgi:hypothetical protein
MNKKTSLAALVLAAAAATAPAATQTKPNPALNLDQRKLSKSEFQALADAQAIIFKGQTLTVGQARSKMKLVTDQARSLQKGVQQNAGPKITAFRKTFLDKQLAALASRNSQVLAEYEQRFAALSPSSLQLKR